MSSIIRFNFRKSFLVTRLITKLLSYFSHQRRRMDSGWSSLPDHLLELILEKLKSSTDYFETSFVCISWHSAAKDHEAKHFKTLRHWQIPILLIPSEEENGRNMFSVMGNKFLDSKLFLSYEKRFCGSSEGWLIAVLEDLSVTIRRPSPVDKETIIRLPPVWNPLFKPRYEYHICKAMITSDPISNPDDYIVVVIYSETYKIAFIRPAKDSVWTYVSSYDDRSFYNFEEVIYLNGQIYALSYRGELLSIDVSNPKIKLIAGKPLAGEGDDYGSIESKRYLVASPEKDLLQIIRFIGYSGGNGNVIRFTKGFEVYKLNFSESKWIEMKDIGNMALFLGDNSSISVLVSDFRGRVKPNSIYFTQDLDTMRLGIPPHCDLGIYDLKRRKFEFWFNMDVELVASMSERPPIWFIPTLY